MDHTEGYTVPCMPSYRHIRCTRIRLLTALSLKGNIHALLTSPYRLSDSADIIISNSRTRNLRYMNRGIANTVYAYWSGVAQCQCQVSAVVPVPSVAALGLL